MRAKVGEYSEVPKGVCVCVRVRVCVCVCVCTQLCLTFCDPMDCSPPGSSVHGILQSGVLEWVAMPSSRHLPAPGIQPSPLMSPARTGRFFSTSATWEAHNDVSHLKNNS